MFVDRLDAGRQLVTALPALEGDVVVLGLPRGGVPVAAEVSRALGAPLDVIVVRKLGLPAQPELAMGAIGEDGVRVINDDVIRSARVSAEDLAAVEVAERAELERRIHRYRGDRPMVDVAGRTALIVDDGIATGATAAAACRVVRSRGARRVVLATPVAPPDTVRDLAPVADDVIALVQPSHFRGVGQFYDDFRATLDDEVAALLAEASG